MSEARCRQEQPVIEASSSGRWTPELTAHVSHCSDCADLALVSGYLQATEELRDPEVDLAQAGRIWRRAEGEKRRKQADKALMPVAIGELTACLFGGVALAGFAARHAVAVAQSVDGAGARLLADPVVALLGTVAAGLLLGVCVFSAILAVGIGAARS